MARGLALCATGESGRVVNLLQRSFRLVLAAGKNQRADRIAFCEFNPRGVFGAKPGQIMIVVGRIPAYPCSSRCKEAQFCAHEFAGSDQKHHAALQIEKHGQESHTTLASPTSGVDWNYFLYMSHSSAAKRKLFLLYCVATIEFSPPESKRQRCIFSTMNPPGTGCAPPTLSKHLRCQKFLAMRSCRRPPWIISTSSRPRASTS